MKNKKCLKKVRNNTFKMGTKMYEKFQKDGGIEHLKASVASYNVTIKAIKYQLLFKQG